MTDVMSPVSLPQRTFEDFTVCSVHDHLRRRRRRREEEEGGEAGGELSSRSSS